VDAGGFVVIRIIAIEREFGCGGGAIAEQLAGRLGWTLYDRQLTCEIARLAQVGEAVARRCDERLDSLLYRLGKVFWRGSYERGLSLQDDKIFDTDRLVRLVQQVVEEAADHGHCVIVGRGAPWFLRGRPDTFSLFLYAPRSEKIRRLMSRVNDQAEAIHLLDTIDDERAAFVKHYFGKQWPTRQLYHAMLNTLLGDEICVATILNCMEAVGKRLKVGTSAG
jgi:cytidylate kinase